METANIQVSSRLGGASWFPESWWSSTNSHAPAGDALPDMASSLGTTCIAVLRLAYHDRSELDTCLDVGPKGAAGKRTIRSAASI